MTSAPGPTTASDGLHPPPTPVVRPTDAGDRNGRLEAILTAAVVTGCALFVFWQLQPGLVFSDTTPTGGDMGAHVWGPAFLRDELLPRGTLTGWTPDWYTGFPAFHFYMVVPALAIVVLDIGLHPVLATLAIAALALGVLWVWTRPRWHHLAPAAAVGALLVAILVVSIPYNVAFKLVAVSGPALFPVGAWALGRLAGLRFPGPAFLALASVLFLFDRSFNIYGGNIASTLAGEFAAAISFTLSLVALGYVLRGSATGRYRAAAAATIALTGLTHLLPAFFLLAAIAVVTGLRAMQRRWVVVPWLVVVGALSALSSAFWVLPFYARTDFLNDMGWERIEIIHSPLVTRSDLNPADVLSDYPPLPVLLLLAAVGFVLSVVRRVELGVVLTFTAGLMAIGFLVFPDGRLWNARILPFYYLCVTLLAGLGVALIVREVARSSIVPRALVVGTAAGMLFIPAVRDAWVWPEPADESVYVVEASLYAIRVYATAALVILLALEVPRQLHRVTREGSVLAALVAVALIAASPARDVRLDSLGTLDGAFWGFVLFGAIATLVAVIARVVLQVARFDAAPVVDAETPTSGPVANAWNEHGIVLRAAPIVATTVVYVLLGLALDVVGGTEATEEGRSWSFVGVDVTSDDNSFVPGWARWNFSGLEAKTLNEGASGDVGKGGWLEYQYVQRTMRGVADERGCGRAFWEFAPELNRYGTTMAMMLLPLWTDGCIASMEGLYFEATPSVPYHFLLQSDLSAPSRQVGVSESVGGPSRAMRDLPYGEFDIDLGVERMHELGVRYYMAFNPRTIEAARNHPGLTEVTSAAPWVVFETTATIVEPLAAVPVVIDGVRDHQDQWLDVGVEWFQSPTAARPASSGPADWARVEAAAVVDRYADPSTTKAGEIPASAPTLGALLPEAPVTATTVVSNIATGIDRIEFDVDRPGAPVLVKASYFPNWTASGADGPYRVAPNFMVVVPTENHVELSFRRKPLDWLALVLTIVGLAGMVAVARIDRNREANRVVNRA